jgi:hypothetical protein
VQGKLVMLVTAHGATLAETKTSALAAQEAQVRCLFVCESGVGVGACE